MKSSRGALFALLLAGIAIPAAATEYRPLSESEKASIAREVIRYFKENPGELVQAIIDWRRRGEEALITPEDPVSGNPAGDVTVIEFTDLGCAPCRETATALKTIVATDGRVKVIHKDLPASGEDASNASLLMIASIRSGAERHKISDLVPAESFNSEAVIAALKSANLKDLSPDRLSAARDALTRNRLLAARLGIKSLPALAVVSGDRLKILTGQLSAEEIKGAVNEVRAASGGPIRTAPN